MRFGASTAVRYTLVGVFLIGVVRRLGVFLSDHLILPPILNDLSLVGGNRADFCVGPVAEQ